MKAIQQRKISRRVEFIASVEKDSKVESKTAVFHYTPHTTCSLFIHHKFIFSTQ